MAVALFSPKSGASTNHALNFVAHAAGNGRKRSNEKPTGIATPERKMTRLGILCQCSQIFYLDGANC